MRQRYAFVVQAFCSESHYIHRTRILLTFQPLWLRVSQIHFGLKFESWNKICLSFQLNTRFGHCGWNSRYLMQLRRAQLCKIDFMYVILSWLWLLAYAKTRLVEGNLECTSMPRSERRGCESKVCFSSIKTKRNWLKLPQEATPTVDQPRKIEDKYLIKLKREVNLNLADPHSSMMKPHFRVYACSQLRADLENAETSYRIGRETVDFTLNELKAKLRELERQVRLRINHYRQRYLVLRRLLSWMKQLRSKSSVSTRQRQDKSLPFCTLN